MSPTHHKKMILFVVIVGLYHGAAGLTKNLTVNANFEIHLNIYEDAGYTTPVTEFSNIGTNQNVYLKAEMEHMDDGQLDLFPKGCFATPSADSEDTLFYQLIADGCPDSSYIIDITTDASSQNPNFAFTTKVFRFTQVDSDSIYFHCNVTICENNACTIPPTAGCPLVTSRRKRSPALTNLKSKRISAKLTVKE